MLSPVRVFSFAFLLTASVLSAPAFAQNVSSGNIVQFNDANSPNATMVSANAAPGPTADASGDPQARVGRISLIDGTVSFHTPDQDSWSYATLNYPVVGGYSFWTEPGSHAEIEAGAAQLRLDGGTEATITQLDDKNIRAEVDQGTANIHVSEIDPGETYQITTPNESVTLLQPGTYRIHPGGGQGPDEIAVLKGSAQVGDSQSTLTVTSGETAVITPGPNPEISVKPTEATAFDNWSLARDNYEEPRAVSHYVSPQMTGDQDLDRYGTWQSDPTYGNVWYPTTVVAGWQPYHYGHWVWVSPWGWTWVDDAPWGFAPFHYGRWVYWHNHWGWVPGERIARPVYAPALVAFVGGSGWSVSVGFGAQPVGWFPLGPGEVYRPPYHFSRGYMRNVNIANVRNATIINNFSSAPQNQRFANRRFATVVSSKDFAASHDVAKAAVRVPESKLAAAPVSASVPGVDAHPRNMGSRAPTPPASVRGPSAPAAPARPQVTGMPHEMQHMDQHATEVPNGIRTSAPGPAIRHHDVNATPSMHAPQFNPATAMPLVAPQRTQQQQAQPNEAFQREQQQRAAGIQARAAAEQNANVQRATQERVVQSQAQQMQPHQFDQRQQSAAPHEIQVQHPQQAAPLVPSRQNQGWVRQQPQAPQSHAEPAHAEPAHTEPTHTEPAHNDAPHDSGNAHQDRH